MSFFLTPLFLVPLFELPSSTRLRKIAKSEKFDRHKMSDFSFQYIPIKIYLKSLYIYSLDIIMLIMPSWPTSLYNYVPASNFSKRKRKSKKRKEKKKERTKREDKKRVIIMWEDTRTMKIQHAMLHMWLKLWCFKFQLIHNLFILSIPCNWIISFATFPPLKNDKNKWNHFKFG